MSFNKDYFVRVTSSANERAAVIWSYKSDDDTMATITTSGYFNDLMIDLTNGIGKVGLADVVFVRASDKSDLLQFNAVEVAVTTEGYLSVTLDSESISTTGNITAGNLIATADVSGVTGTFSGAVSMTGITASGNTILGTDSDNSITFNAKLAGQLYRNETGVDSKSLKLHNHDTAATMNNEFKYETINTSGSNYGTWNECHIAASGTASLRAQTNVAVVEATVTATDTTLIGSYAQVRADGDVAGDSFLSSIYGIVGASAAMTASHVNALWLDTHMANAITGSYQLIYMTENGATALDQVMYIRTPGAVAFAEFDTCSAFVSATAETGGTAKKIKITIDGVVHYINAYTG